MPSFNKIILVGHLGRDPELRYTPEGTPVCEFTIATNAKKSDPPTWFKVTCWRNTAENVEKYLRKGSTAFVSGVLTSEEWTDKEGHTRQTLKVNADDVKFLDGKEQAQAATFTGTPLAGTAPPSQMKANDDDSRIPF